MQDVTRCLRVRVRVRVRVHVRVRVCVFVFARICDEPSNDGKPRTELAIDPRKLEL